MQEIFIRSAEVSDIPAIQAVGAAAWRSKYHGLLPDDYIEGAISEWWSESTLKMAIVSPENSAVVAEQDGQIIGILIGQIRPIEGGSARLYRTYVHPRHFRKGVGRALWQAYRERLQPGIKQLYTGVIAINEQARGFYRSLGFEEIGTRQTESFGHNVESMELVLKGL